MKPTIRKRKETLARNRRRADDLLQGAIDLVNTLFRVFGAAKMKQLYGFEIVQSIQPLPPTGTAKKRKERSP